MTTPHRWTLRTLAAVALLAVPTASATAQQRPRTNSVVVQPSINTFPGFPINPYALPAYPNPALNNPWMNQFQVVPVGPFGPVGFPPAASTPPIAVQQPGMMLYKGPDLQVNPRTGTVYRPQTGTATLADGSTFYRVPGSGLPNALGNYIPGTGLYYNPQGGTFFNPATGVISKPGTTNVFVPYIW